MTDDLVAPTISDDDVQQVVVDLLSAAKGASNVIAAQAARIAELESRQWPQPTDPETQRAISALMAELFGDGLTNTGKYRKAVRAAFAAADALAPPTGPWSYLRDNEAGPGWDWIVVRPGEGENITDLDEATARMIVRDHNRSVAPAGVPEGWKDKILAVLKENIRLTARTDSESMCADCGDPTL
jgi:hypothetical protein